ncbi:hypothetical protein GCM10009827_109570 [Dactylosporangium maewongense]|uniref:Protein NO VEIN C-terminal domain-containing protein n=1 Tax=Dactylosporangium maewongense TaxID=634393 RepID=A0ABP4P0I8_9ACTN
MSTLVDAVQQLRTQLLREHEQAPGLFGEIARIEALLAETYRNRVLYEFLQNSDDAGATVVTVDLRLPGTVHWRNNGRPFDAADVEALCRSASSTKHRDGGSIGYRGIGFKAVAAVAAEVTVASNGVALTFDRAAAAGVLGVSDAAQVPLLRIPANVKPSTIIDGAAFTLGLSNAGEATQLALDPIALPFLRHLRQVTVLRPSGEQRLVCRVEGDMVRLVLDGVEATFHRLAEGDTVVLVPADVHAERLTGVRGRLACFLPLEDELAIPIVASGDILTDPSRTHAVVSDTATQAVLRQMGRLVATALRDGPSAVRDRLWELLMQGEDLRTVAIGGDGSAAAAMLTAISEELARRPLPFAFSEVPLAPGDLPAVFPHGAPPAIYAEQYASQARALRTVLGAQTLRIEDLLERVDNDQLTEGTRRNLAARVVDIARAQGRALTPREQGLVGKNENETTLSAVAEKGSAVPQWGNQAISFSGAIQRWRAAEIAVLEFLNALGWHLKDVSRQNLGYDLDGTMPDGTLVHLEVKKVDGRDSRFALTNNEMAVMISGSARYLLAIVIGDESASQLALLDPLKDNMPRERVCRRWDWEYTDWSRFAQILA